jgi:hypothetical protein
MALFHIIFFATVGSRLAEALSFVAAPPSKQEGARKKLIVHVGPWKTGTTYIQHVFGMKQDALLAQKVLYPMTTNMSQEANSDALLTNYGHHFLADHYMNDQTNVAEWSVADHSNKEHTEHILSQVADAHDKHIIISTENLFNLKADQWKKFSTDLISVSAHDIEVVMFYRSCRNTAESGYDHELKQAKFTGLFADWLFTRYMDGQCDMWHDSSHQNIVDAFGASSVKVVDYEGAMAPGSGSHQGDIALALLEVTGLRSDTLDKALDLPGPPQEKCTYCGRTDNITISNQMWFNFVSVVKAHSGAVVKYEIAWLYKYDFSKLHYSKFDIPVNCADLTSFNQLNLDSYARFIEKVGGKMEFGNLTAFEEGLIGTTCDFDASAVMDNLERWMPIYQEQLQQLPEGVTVEYH